MEGRRGGRGEEIEREVGMAVLIKRERERERNHI